MDTNTEKKIYTIEEKQLLADRVKKITDQLNLASGDCHKAGLRMQISQVPNIETGEVKFLDHVFEVVHYITRKENE